MSTHGSKHEHHHHDHDDHDHPHTHDERTFQPDLKEPSEEWEFLEIALRELLIEKGVVTAREIQDMLEEWDGKCPENGARIVARAWTEPAFKKRLLADGNKAVGEMGFEIPGLKLVVLVGSRKALRIAIQRTDTARRFSLLRWRLQAPADHNQGSRLFDE